MVFKQPNIEEKTWTIKDNHIVNKMAFIDLAIPGARASTARVSI